MIDNNTNSIIYITVHRDYYVNSIAAAVYQNYLIMLSCGNSIISQLLDISIMILLKSMDLECIKSYKCDKLYFYVIFSCTVKYSSK